MGNYIEGEKTYSGNLYEDYRLFRQYIYEDFERCVQYKEYSDQLERLAKDNVEFYMKMNNVASKKENEYIAKTYNNRKIDFYYRTESFDKYFSYTFSSILMIIMCFLGIAPMYVSEREISMWNVLNTTCIGHKCCENVKIFSSMIYASIIVFWFRLLDYLTYCFLFDMEGMKNPIWSIEGFEKSPLNCSVGDYVLYDIGMKTLAVYVIALAILLLSLCMAKIIHVAIGFAIFLGIWLLMANGMDSFRWWISGLKMCSPLMLMDCYGLFSEFIHIEMGKQFVRGEVLAKISAFALLLLEFIVLKIFKGERLEVCRKFYLHVMNVRRIRT